jgi:alkanesulfonate monooxygenase
VHFAGKYFRVEDARVNTPFVSTADQPPEIFVSGGSQAARNLAARHGTCWMTMGDTPERIGQEGKPILQAGKELGIRLSIICESTREKAIRTAQAIVDRAQSSARNFEEERRFVRQSDSQSMGIRYAAAESEWLGHWLWSGAVRIYGAPAIAIVGTPEIAASAMLEYKRVGVTHFILSGWPKREAMERFGREVLPLVRELEKKELVLA